MIKFKIDTKLARTATLADKAAYERGRSEHANTLFDRSQLRIRDEVRRGRGAAINPAGRFENIGIENFEDGWGGHEPPQPIRTSVQIEKPKTIITSNQSPDIMFDRSINIYRGCEHGCIYCFARPSHSYMGLSAGLDFETKLFAKANAGELLRNELSKPNYQPRMIAIGTNTDAYQPIEKTWQIMPQILDVLNTANHPVSITTKSALILRDIERLTQLAQKNLVRIIISITTLDRRLARRMEPRAATPERRFHIIEMLHKRKIPVAVMVAPIIPSFNDHELEAILQRSRSNGAASASYTMVRLPFEVSPLFKDWLLREYPDRYRRVMNHIRQMRGGKDYDAQWNKRMKAEGPYAEIMARRFKIACEKYGFNNDVALPDFAAFQPPLTSACQLNLF